MISQTYHNISQSVLGFAIRNPKMKFLAYPILIIDNILMIDIKNFTYNRRQVVGDTYFGVQRLTFNIVVYKESYDDLRDHIRKIIDEGSERNGFAGAVHAEPPLVVPAIAFSKDEHDLIRPLFWKIKDQTKNITRPKYDTILENTYDTINKTLYIKLSADFLTYLYKYLLGIDLDTYDNIDPGVFTKKIDYAVYLVLKGKILPGEEYKSSIINLKKVIADKYNIDSELAGQLIAIMEIAAKRGVWELFKQTMIEINNNKYIDIIRNELSRGNSRSLNECIIEASRFIANHPGRYIKDITSCDETLIIKDRVIDIKKGTMIIYSVPGAQCDEKKYSDVKSFCPYRKEQELTRSTMFLGYNVRDSHSDRSCIFQDEALSIVSDMCGAMISNYSWDDCVLADDLYIDKVNKIKT